MLSLLYSTIDDAKGDMSAYITQIVVKFFQPQAEQEWQAIITAVSSVVGLLTFIAIIIDAYTAGASTGLLVAAIVGVQSTLAAAANFKNGFEGQKPDATYLAIDGNYSQSVVDYSRGLQELINNMWSNTELQSSGIAEAIAGGAWLDVGNPYNVTGITEEAKDWLDNLLVTSYINRVFNDADAFIVFLPYKKYVYSGVYGRTEIMDFNQEECSTHWANDPSWKYYATCDVKLGGEGGMAVVTRPTSQGTGSKTWTSEVEWVWASYTWDAQAFVDSAVTGFGEHGFGYNLTNLDFSTILNKGSQEAIDQWKTLPLSTPGLFNIPVCVLTNMMDLPGGGVVATDVSQYCHLLCLALTSHTDAAIDGQRRSLPTGPIIMRRIELHGYWRQILRQRLGEYQKGHWMSLNAHTIHRHRVSKVAIHFWLDELESFATYGSHLFFPIVLAA